jgi:hypothetical protein
MGVCIGLLMLAVYFILPAHHKWNMIKVDWLAACIALRVVGAVVIFLQLSAQFAQSSSQWEARADT